MFSVEVFRYTDFASDDASYQGDWRNDRRSGCGTQEYIDGTVYDGEWRNGLRNGRGKCSYWNRGVYEGKWINDVRAGLGQVRATL